MSKRRINKQQRIRIEKNQQSYHSNQTQKLSEGLVISRFSKTVEIEDSSGKRLLCSIRPNLETLVAGDRIIWQQEGEDQGVVVSLCPRSSLLERLVSADYKKPVAANLSQLIIVLAPKPEISWPLLDSYLVLAENLGFHALIVLNKTDLPCESLKSQLLANYAPLNYPLILMNSKDPTSFQALNKALAQQTSIFVGQSGVGKSTIISKLLPHESNIATQEISALTELGRHTTSNARYYHLSCGGALIDSPGVREFSLSNLNTASLAQGYIEFRPFLPLCKFRNCTHIDTPSCAIIKALEEHLISKQRYDNFIKLSAQVLS